MGKHLLIGLSIFIGSLSWAGGIDGGGGGTTPANPISITQVFATIRTDAKSSLRLYFRNLERRSHFQNVPPYNAKLFGGAKTILDVLESTDIEVPDSKPCYDAFGNEVDGSVHSTKPNAICISAFRIAPKLILERAIPEILALIAHELSHVLGTTEAEAEAFQRRAVEDLRFANGEDSLRYTYGAASKIDKALELSKRDIHSMSPDALVLMIENLKTNFDLVVLQTTLALFTEREDDYYRFHAARLELLRWYALSKSSDQHAVGWGQKYNSLFNASGEVKFSDTDISNAAHNQFGYLTIRQVQNNTDLQAQLEDFAYYASKLRKHLSDMANINLLADLPDPAFPFVNPWIAFIGKYHVSKLDCVSKGNPDIEIQMKTITDFEIMPLYGNEQPNMLYLIQYSSTGENHGDSLYPEATEDWNAVGTVKSFSESGRAYNLDQTGDAWDYMSRDLMSIEQVRSGYQFQRTYTDFGLTGPGQAPYDRSITCTYQLEKQ